LWFRRRGTNTFTGGQGADIFILDKNNEATDRVTDFSISQGDKIELDNNGIKPASFAVIGLRVSNSSDGNAQLIGDSPSDDGHIYMILEGLDQSQISLDHFIFEIS
jgi:Ca2+-binding RTX toxin-like protein